MVGLTLLNHSLEIKYVSPQILRLLQVCYAPLILLPPEAHVLLLPVSFLRELFRRGPGDRDAPADGEAGLAHVLHLVPRRLHGSILETLVRQLWFEGLSDLCAPGWHEVEVTISPRCDRLLPR